MSYANQFRKKSGLDMFGTPVYAQGCFWSAKPFNRMSKVTVSNNQFSVPIEVEIHQSTFTRKTAQDFDFFLRTP